VAQRTCCSTDASWRVACPRLRLRSGAFRWAQDGLGVNAATGYPRERYQPGRSARVPTFESVLCQTSPLGGRPFANPAILSPLDWAAAEPMARRIRHGVGCGVLWTRSRVKIGYTCRPTPADTGRNRCRPLGLNRTGSSRWPSVERPPGPGIARLILEERLFPEKDLS